MNWIKNHRCALVTMLGLSLAALLLPIGSVAAAVETTFPVLQTKTVSYTNVTVTSKTKEWIFILHAGGMGNIKVAELPSEVQAQLGYEKPKEKKPLGAISMPKLKTLTDLKIPEMAQLEQNWREGGATGVVNSLGNPVAVQVAFGVVVLMYLFFSYCSMMICSKTHTAPGVLVWVPVLQIFPLLRAAGMPRMWFLAFLLPVVNLVALLVWYVKIVEARSKSKLLVLWLVLPFTSPFAFLYLAFSSAATVPTSRSKKHSFALQTA